MGDTELVATSITLRKDQYQWVITKCPNFSKWVRDIMDEKEITIKEESKRLNL